MHLYKYVADTHNRLETRRSAHQLSARPSPLGRAPLGGLRSERRTGCLEMLLAQVRMRRNLRFQRPHLASEMGTMF